MKLKYSVCTLILSIFLIQGAWAQYVPKDKRKADKDSVRQEEVPPPAQNTSRKEKEKKPSELSEQSFFQRLQLIPNFGLSIGNQTTVIEAGPQIGYRFTENFTAGLGGYYLYFRQRYDFLTGGTVETFTIDGSYYGGNLFARYFPIPQGFIHVELENMNVEFFNQDDGAVERVWQFAPLVGGGYSQGGFFAAFLYNLDHDSNTSWRGSPWITRFGFSF